MPKVSIIVPVYNTERYLPQCVDSILSQTFTDFELLLIDDGSKDDSGKICDEYALDPTYEPNKSETDTQEVKKEHEAIFATLQKYVKLNLVVPVGAEHMYYAAINRKACKLTAQGQHYWRLVNKNTI